MHNNHLNCNFNQTISGAKQKMKTMFFFYFVIRESPSFIYGLKQFLELKYNDINCPLNVPISDLLIEIMTINYQIQNQNIRWNAILF
jgi:hypothetical protein